jgi:serine/threonine protein phosphatase PrpC
MARWCPPPARHKGVALALADGISSSRVSQVASAAAVRSFLEDYYGTAETWTVRRAVLEATNAWLHAQTRRSDARFDPDRGYVCTFSALILKGREATCCMWATAASTACIPRRWKP